MSEITIFLLYLLAGLAFGCTRLPRFAALHNAFLIVAFLMLAIGLSLHCQLLYKSVFVGGGFDLSTAHIASMIGLELALIATIANVVPSLRGIGGGMLLLAALTALVTLSGDSSTSSTPMVWQIRAHILTSLLSYGLLTVGAIVAVYAMLQERRLHARRLSPTNNLFAPLETTERLLFSIASAGFAGLALAILSGLTFVDNLFAQHLAHKTVFSILALIVFGALLAGRTIAGWRGKRAIKLYLGGFLLLCVAYFGTRLILEQLNLSWS